jgi:hypothetical protein
LIAELIDTREALDPEGLPGFTMAFPDGSTVEVHVAFLQPLILEDAARSGLFGSVDTSNWMLLARKMRVYNNKVSYFQTAVVTERKNLIHHAITNIEDTHKAIARDTEQLLQTLAELRAANAPAPQH